MISRRKLLALTGAITSQTLLSGLAPANPLKDRDTKLWRHHGSVKALTFDVFGTVFDWRSSIINEGQRLSRLKGLHVHWPKFADAWRDGYMPVMQRVRDGELPYSKIDKLHRIILDELVKTFELQQLTDSELTELNRVWHRLNPWPDSVRGLDRLREHYLTASLSNGNMSLLVDLAKNAGIQWDCVLSAELTGYYKPDRQVYVKAADLLDLQPKEIMMVAAHPIDLRAAAKVGYRTALVLRPFERGRESTLSFEPDAKEYDVIASDFEDLADQMSA